MSVYRIEVPITGTAIIEVEAESEEEARMNAKITADDIQEWSVDMYRSTISEVN